MAAPIDFWPMSHPLLTATGGAFAWAQVTAFRARKSRIICPSCGSQNIRHSRRRNLLERLLGFLPSHPFRCRDCRERFWLPFR